MTESAEDGEEHGKRYLILDPRVKGIFALNLIRLHSLPKTLPGRPSSLLFWYLTAGQSRTVHRGTFDNQLGSTVALPFTPL